MFEDSLQRSAGAYRRPWPILVAAAIVTAVLAGGIPRLTVDNDIKSMLPKTDRTRALTELYDGESNFGSSNAVFVGVEAADVYSLDTLQYIKKLQDEISDLDRSLPVRQMARLLRLSPEESAKVMDDLRSVGINDLNYGETLVPLLGSSEALRKRFGWEAGLADKVARNAAGVPGERLFGAYESPLGQIQSLVNGDYIAYEDDALVAKKLVDGGLPTAESVAGLKERVESWDTYEGVLVSKDGRLAAITVTIRTEDKDVKAMLNADLQRISANPPPGIEVFVAGEPVIVDHLANVIAKDLPVLTPLMALVLVAILFLCFRSAQGIFYPLLVTLLAVIWTFGLMGYLGLPLTIVSSTMPVLLMAIVSAYGIHQMNHYYEDRGTGKFEVLRHNARSVGLAILLSGLSVMIGFGSMVTLDFVPIRNFGILTAFGDLVGVLAALYALPALLMLGSPEKKGRKYVPEDQKRDLIARLLRRVKTLGREVPGRVLAVAGLAALVLALGATMVRSDLDLTKFFPPGDTVRVADRVLNERMAGTKSLSVVLDTDLREPLTRKGNPDSLVELTTPEVLEKVDAFARDVKAAYPNVTKVYSYADVLKKMNQVINGGDPRAYAIPDDASLIGQYLVIFSGDTKTLLTDNHDKLRIMMTMNEGSLDDIHKIALYARSYFDRSFLDRNHLQVQVVGEQQISYESNRSLLKGTMEGIFACVAIVFLLLLFSLRDFRMSLVAVVPVLLCLVVDFGYLGFSGTTLNTATALVSSIGIGIGIDFSIHFITWYRRELRVDRDVLAAVDRTILHKGRAILYNLFVIAGGFLVLLGSQMGPLRDFGFLTALCLTVTAISAIVVVPAIIRLLARKDRKFLYLGVEEASDPGRGPG